MLIWIILAIAALAVVAFAVSSQRLRAPAVRVEQVNPYAGAVAVISTDEEAEPFNVVGESHYQEALESICGGREEDGADEDVMAVLQSDDGNIHDDQAVAVLIEGRPVGFLAREDARLFRSEIRRLGAPGRKFACQAYIVGGWDRGGGDRGHFGVELDLAAPIYTRT